MRMHVKQFPWFDYSFEISDIDTANDISDSLVASDYQDMSMDEIVLALIDCYSLIRYHSRFESERESEAWAWEMAGIMLAGVGLHRQAIQANFRSIRLYRAIPGAEYAFACVCLNIVEIFEKIKIYPNLAEKLKSWADEEIEKIEGSDS